MEKKKKNVNTNDQDYMSETRVLERMTDENYEQNEKNSRSAQNDLDDTSFMSETRVLERMTDSSYTDQDSQKKQKQQDPYFHKATVKKKTNPAVKEARSFLIDLAVCILAVLLITNYVIRPIQVEGNSMYPTLHDDAIGVSDLIGYRLNGIKRFDVVIVYLSEKNEYIVKRVIGLPGETVSYENEQLYINGEKVDEPFLDQSYVEQTENSEGIFMSDVQPITLGNDEYFCLGDNRPHSTDSRFYGPFKASQIVSKGIFICWPLSQIGARTW